MYSICWCIPETEHNLVQFDKKKSEAIKCGKNVLFYFINTWTLTTFAPKTATTEGSLFAHPSNIVTNGGDSA
jgi:hypothetical protein